MARSYLETALVTAGPSFADQWAALRGAYPPGAAPSAEDLLGALQTHAHLLLMDGRVAEVTRLFYALERLLAGADPILQDLLEQKFLGPLAKACRDVALDPRLLVPHLGPRSRAVWDRALA
jgi:hypothetical protein